MQNAADGAGNLTCERTIIEAGERAQRLQTRGHVVQIIWATVHDVRVAGALVKIEAEDDDRRAIQVELGRQEYAEVRVIVGERLYVRPRHVRVFMHGTDHRR